MSINAERLSQSPVIITDIPADKQVVISGEEISILNPKIWQGLGINYDRGWSQDDPPLGGLSPTPTTNRTPQPVGTVVRISPTPPATETKIPPETPTPTPTEGLQCIITDLKGVINDEGNHFEEGRVVDGYVENISTNPECPDKVRIWVYGSNQYPETPGWLESQKYLFGYDYQVPAGTRQEINQEIPGTNYDWCQVDLVRADVEPTNPPEPPYLSGDKMIDYVFVRCKEEVKPTEQPTPSITEAPTKTPAPKGTPRHLIPSGNPPSEEETNWELVGAYIIAGTAIAGFLWKRKRDVRINPTHKWPENIHKNIK